MQSQSHIASVRSRFNYSKVRLGTIVIEHIIVSESSYKSSDALPILQSNVKVVDELLYRFVHHDEIFSDALKSYYVYQYANYMQNGGFAEYVYRTAWARVNIDNLVAGLEALDADAHIELLARLSERFTFHGADGVACLYDLEHPQNQQMRDYLNELMPEYEAINAAENLTELNAAWLKRHPALVAMSDDALKKQIEVSAKAIPNRTQRIAKALADEPRYLKLIRLLCDSANLEFLYLTPSKPNETKKSDDASVWHFQTSQGPYYLSDNKSEAAIFNSDTQLQVAQVRIEEVEAS
jgi:hypothetical protein